VLGHRRGRALAIVEAKRMAIDPLGAEKQARDYAVQLGVPFVFLANGKEIWCWDYEREAHPHQVKTFFSQADLERRTAARATRRDLMAVATDSRAGGQVAGLAIGVTVVFNVLIAGAISGGSMNPARSLGPALFGSHESLHYYWIYLVGPFGGAVAAALLYEAIRGDSAFAKGAPDDLIDKRQ